jgi:hypothetical protein
MHPVIGGCSASDSPCRITTRRGTYLYHKQGAGLASLIGLHGYDWIRYGPGSRLTVTASPVEVR